jgi:TonB family protein
MHKRGVVLQIGGQIAGTPASALRCKMTGMSRIRSAFAAAVLVSALWAQSDDHHASNSAAGQPAESKLGAAAPAPVGTPGDSTKLEPIKIVKAVYPEAAKAEKLEGRVIVKAVISETGDVDSVEVVTGNAVLAAAALDAVKQWKFKPFIKGGKPIRISVKLPCDFTAPIGSLEDQPAVPAANDAPDAGTLTEAPMPGTPALQRTSPAPVPTSQRKSRFRTESSKE